MSNISLATLEVKVARHTSFYESVLVTTDGDAGGKDFISTSLAKYEDGSLAGKWYRITQSTTVKTGVIKNNFSEEGKITLYDAFGAAIVEGSTVQLFSFDPAIIAECINDAIEMSYPELSKAYDDRATTTPTTAPYYCTIPTGIKRVQRVEVGFDSTDQGNWLPLDFEEVFSGTPLVKKLKLINYQYQGSMLRIAGVGVIGAYTTLASTLDIPEEWVRPLVLGACYNLYTRLASGLSNNDSKEADVIATKFNKEYMLQKAIRATAHFNDSAQKQFEVISEG
jgi:hypothetical protein